MTLLPVSHRRQQQQADCLTACAAMVLDYQQRPIPYDRLLWSTAFNIFRFKTIKRHNWYSLLFIQKRSRSVISICHLCFVIRAPLSAAVSARSSRPFIQELSSNPGLLAVCT